MTNDTDRALDHLAAQLPEPLRKDWVVVPKRVLTQAAIASMALGAAGALMVVGFVQDDPALRWAWPGVVVVLMLLTRFCPGGAGTFSSSS